MSKSDVLRLSDYLGHIVQAIDRIQRYVDDMTEPTFFLDEKTQDAVIRNFEVVWRTIHSDLPELRAQVAALIDPDKH